MSRRILLFSLTLCAVSAMAQRSDNYLPTAATDVELETTNLPIVFLNVNGNTIQRDSRITAWCKIIDNGDGNLNYGDTIAYPNQTVDYEGYVGLRYRGNSSFNSSDKKPYSFRPFDNPVESGGKKKKAKIMGMAKDNDWAMLAPFSDKSMIRDVLTFELARPFFDFVPHSRFCELILDGTYYGVYIMCELVTKGNNRLDLNDPGDDDGDLTGDYLVEIDRDDEDYYYVSDYHPFDSDDNPISSRKIIYQYKSPEYEDFAELPTGTLRALQNEIDKMEDSFMLDDYTDEETGYRSYIDEISFIDYMLATELAFNIDGYRLSTKLYKHSDARYENEGLDPRWKTSLWDFNIAFGNANYYDGYRTDLWQYKYNNRQANNDAQLVPFYWNKMMNDDTFVTEVKNRWQEYREGSYSDERLFATIDSLTTVLTSGGAVDRNQEAWGNIGVYAWPNYYVGSTYDDEINWLKEWIEDRLSYMDRHLLPTDYDDTEPVTVASGWDSDVIVESLPAESYCSVAIDITRTFYAESAKSDGGLPDDRSIVTTEGTKFTLSPYDENNAMFIQDQGYGGDIVFEEPFATSTLFMLATSTSGDSEIILSVKYDDGSYTDMESYTIQDWSVREPDGSEAVTALGNVILASDDYSSDNHYCLFEIPIYTDKSKNIVSVSVRSASSSRPAIFAFSRGITSTSGIRGTERQAEHTVTGIYTIGGMKIATPQRGINIIRYSDGTSRKVLVK